MNNKDVEDLRATIAALEAQRATLGDAVVDMATAPLRAKLAGMQPAAGLQHRQVTVLFADVVGSTAMAQGLEAEDALTLLGEAMRRMADIVQAHRGRVLRFTGDGVKAAFGMDAAHEDDAELAVRAGLAILDAGRALAEEVHRAQGVADFAVRVGLHTGDVALGAGIEADNTAMGVAVNVAARMEQTAPPGAMRISHDTWSLVRGLFDVEAQPPLLAKGIEVPMLTYLVRAALDRSVATVERGLQGLRTALVGRDAELQRLLSTVESARQTRQLQALTLIGDAGLGKSRLLREMTAALRAGPAECRIITLRTQPDGVLRPWGLLRTLLATEFSVADTDSAEVARRKVVEGLSPCFDERGEQQAQLIGQLSGLDFGDSPHVRGLDPRSLRDHAFKALRGYLQSLARLGDAVPVLVVEDLHWADDGSLDLLQHLLAHAAELPLALVMSARPALLARRPDWGTPETTVQLSPLAAAQSDELAQALLQRMDEVPPKLTELIVGRSEGNPYYMEELLRRLVDDGVITVGEPHWTVQVDRLDTVQLPSTLVGLLQARLDALPAGERRAVRQASVIGHVFWDDALLALDAQAPLSLPALGRAAFVRDHGTSDFEGTLERRFDHHLLHQVTYDTLLKAERKLGHGAAARWLQERTKGRSAEYLAMTGEHAERAGEVALAVDCFEQAAKEAANRFANSIAQSYFRRALALLGQTDPPRAIDLWSELGRVADTMGDRDQQQTAHAEMAALLERHPDDARRARLLFAQALLADRRGDSTLSEPLARQAYELAELSGAAQWAAMAQGQLAWLQIARQNYAGATVHIETGLPWAGKIDDAVRRAETEAQLLTLSGMVSECVGRLGEARTTLQAVLSRGETLGKPRLQLGAMDNLAAVANNLGQWNDTAAWGERMLALADSIGSPKDVAMAHLRLAEAAEAQGDTAAAIRRHEQSLVIHRAIANRRMEAIALRFMARLKFSQGDARTALQCSVDSQALHRDLNEPLEACLAATIAAQCQFQLGQPAAALEGLDAVLDRLRSELSEYTASETIGLRWKCCQLLQALGDGRAAPLLAQLHADVQATAAERTDAADRDRLIRAIPTFRDIVAAHQGL